MSQAILTEMFIDSERGQNRFFRRALGPLFKLNGNDFIVTLSRLVATSAGKAFVYQSAKRMIAADPKSIEFERNQRYLAELNITDPAMVIRWWDRTAGGTKNATWTGDPTQPFQDETLAVQNAISKFVHEAILKPNGAERPTYAHTPIGGLVFNLKTFAYTHSKRVMGGLYRESKSRYDENGKFNDMLPFLLATTGMFMVFGAMSDELRNRIKSLGAKGTWEANRQSPVAVTKKWIDRAGYTAMPFYDAIPIPYVKDVSAFDVSFALGPTSSHLFDLFADGDGIDKGEVLRSIPVVSQVNALRSALQ